VIACVVAFACSQGAREWPRPGLRPAHTAGAVTADQWVGDLESERARGTGGSNLSASAVLNSKNAELGDRDRASVGGGGCISGGV